MGAVPPLSLGRRVGQARRLEAWVRGYAKSRKLELVDRWRWHSDHRALPLPGFADHVLAGPIPGHEGRGVVRDARRCGRAALAGKEIAYVSERPLASSALVVRLERAADGRRVAALKLPDEYEVGHAGQRGRRLAPGPGQPPADVEGLG